jgi:hypothetical protein
MTIALRVKCIKIPAISFDLLQLGYVGMKLFWSFCLFFKFMYFSWLLVLFTISLIYIMIDFVIWNRIGNGVRIVSHGVSRVIFIPAFALKQAYKILL